jgi:UDPglucose--hexose-1-phosphate uridylyltransferase
MSELRWNPLLGTWTIVAANRQNRPNMPKDYCPFCPGEGKKVPDKFNVFTYANDFPALSGSEEVALQNEKSLYVAAPASGNCEVLLYSPDHHAHIKDLPAHHMNELVALWAERTAFYASKKEVKYVYVFENRGAEVGVTMPHPHGQLYAFPFIPHKLEIEQNRSKKYFEETGNNLFDEMIIAEKQDTRRIIFENEHFMVFLPFFTDYPYGVFIIAKSALLYLNEMNAAQKSAFAEIFQNTVGMLDQLFQKSFPYMMCMHQGALNSPGLEHQSDWFRFHVEFYPPLRAENTIKYYASAEMGAWAATNTRAVEDTAIELKNALQIYLQSKS